MVDRHTTSYLLQEEHDYLVPSGYFEIGIGMLGPTMMVWGKDEDKKRYLPKMITGEEIWCQLFQNLQQDRI